MKYAVYFEQINQARIEIEASDKDMARAKAVKEWYDTDAKAHIIATEELED